MCGILIFATTTVICYFLNKDKFEDLTLGETNTSIFDFKSKIIPLVIVLLNVIARKAIETILSFGKPETFTEYLILNT